MCYKEDLQRKNEENLQRRLEKDQAPLFIRRYFINIESKAAAINYWVAIKDLAEWLIKENIIKECAISSIMPSDFNDVESEDITLYLKHKEKSGMSPTTLATRKNIFSSFWHYLERSKKCPVDVNIIKDVSYKGIAIGNNLIRKLPTDQQLKDMENKILEQRDDFLRGRNMTIINVLKGTGIRESELVGLDWNDVFLDEEMPYIKVIGKGKYRQQESRVVYLTGKAIKSLNDWNCFSKTMGNHDPVFITKKGKRMSESEIKSLFHNKSNGEITPHMIRHWYATIMAQDGNIAFTQQQLGHTSSATTINNYANGSYGMKDYLLAM